MFGNVMQLAKSQGRLAVRKKLGGFGFHGEKHFGSPERLSPCLNFMVSLAESQHATLISTKATLKTFNIIMFPHDFVKLILIQNIHWFFFLLFLERPFELLLYKKSDKLATYCELYV